MESLLHLTLSLLSCSTTHLIIYVLNKKLANSLTCCIFQIYFISQSFNNLYLEYFEKDNFSNIRNYTLIILYQATGYFIYDIINLIYYKDSQWKLYTAHHIVAIIMIIIMIHEGIHETWNHNMVCLISEIINPALNIRSALAYWFGKNSIPYIVNRYIIIIQYTIFRVIAFPIVAYNISPFIHNNATFIIIYTLTIALYGTSLLWYQKLIKNMITKRYEN